MTIIIFIVIIAFLVFIHELGHFSAAKLFGVRVDEFGIGFPPRLLSWKKGETLYSLNFIPFGGFVRIFGENPNEESEHGQDRARSLTAKPYYQQALILVGGVFFNWLLAWLLISIGFMSGLPMAADGAKKEGLILDDISTMVLQVSKESPAALAGLKPGDKIIAIKSGLAVKTNPTVAEFQDIIRTSAGEVVVDYERGGDVQQVFIKPLIGLTAEGKAIGVALDQVGNLQLNPLSALWYGFGRTFDMTRDLTLGLKDIIVGLFSGDNVKEAVMGPVGIAGLVGDARALGIIYLLTFAAFISLDLAIINLIPFPALDGGRLLFLLIEAVKGSPIKPIVANSLNAVGFLLLIGLMLLVTIFDVLRLF